MLQPPPESQSVQPVLLPLLLQQLPPRQVLEAHSEEEEHAPPSDVLETKHSLFARV